MTKSASPEDLKELMESGAAHAVLDARDPMEFHEKQIFGTTNAPRAAIEFLAPRLVPVRTTPVVCVDEGGPRAGRVATLLEESGYADVRVLEGGWAHGRPGVFRPPRARTCRARISASGFTWSIPCRRSRRRSFTN